MQNRNVSVLVLDDDRSLLDAFSRRFARAGYRCITTQSGEEALARISNEQIDVVVTDLAMPGMSGLDFIRQARTRNADLPIIVMTGHAAMDTAIESIDAGVFRYLTKPVDPVELFTCISDALHARALTEARLDALSLLTSAEAPSPSSAVVQRAIDTAWLVLQPIVSTFDQRLIAYEASLRTCDPALSDSGALLVAAQRLDMLPVMGRAARTLAAAIIPTMPVDVDLFLKLHPHDLSDERLFSSNDPLHAFASRVVLQVTERSTLEEIPDARARITKLKKMGYRIALDDMGSGYASFRSFIMLEPTFLKIDMTLVRDLDGDTIKQTLVRTLIALACELGVKVIAEGVGSSQERETLERLGCNRQQGNLFAPPGRRFPTVSWSPAPKLIH